MPKTNFISSAFSSGKILAIGLGLSILSSCGGDSEDDPIVGVSGLTITSDNASEGSRSIAANFTVPEEDGDVSLGGMALPVARSKTAAQEALSASSYDSYLPFYQYWHYKDLQPHPELYCDEPVQGEFAEIAETLGGFRKTTSIFIEPDATAPRVQTGWMTGEYLKRFLPVAEDASGGEGGVNIQRPNVVGQSGSKVFYQSDIYGLITVDFANVPFTEPQVSCAQPLPGTPQNFVVTDENLYVILKDTSSMSSAVIQFDVTGGTPQYVKGVVLQDQDVIDARLFNDTLVMYLKTYAPIEVQPAERIASPVGGTDSAVGEFAIIRPLPRYSREYVYHELVVLDTLPSLAVAHRESFIPEGSDNPVGDSRPSDPEALYVTRNFNNFLSASGEYLLVTENVRERHFVEYETKSYNQCQEYQVVEVPYHYCRTQWKRIENPDYTPPPASGVLSCSGTLSDCLKTQGPRVSRYINVADGQQCYDGVRNRYNCLSSKTITYDVPQYRWENKTQVYAYRFNSGEFIRLDDQLATINKEQQIETADRRFTIDGRVQKHDHMQFSGDNLYIIATAPTNGSADINLHTLTIAGNSPVYVNQLSIAARKYANLSAVFSDDTIYLSEGSFTSSSNLNTLSLADPLAPTLDADVSIATSLKQLFFVDDGLLGLGRTTIQIDQTEQSYSLGTITRFSTGGDEQNSLLLGADYRYYSSSAEYDDQVAAIDQSVKRLFVPYTVSRPMLGNEAPYSQYRLTVADFSDAQLREEGTLSFPQGLDRTLSVDEQTAFGFSQEFIHQLTFEGDMESATIFDGELPESIYYARETSTQIQKRVQPNSYSFRLIDSGEEASGVVLDEVSVPRAHSSVCLSEQVLFDRDRVVVVSVKPNTYIDYQDCPSNRNDVEKVFTGYRISEGKLVPISDQDEMFTVWLQSTWDMVCVTDSDNQQGEILESFDLDDVESLDCFTQTQYYQKLSDLLELDSSVVF